jgi:transcriptional regulator with AAA-type ATPase domain
MSQDGKEGTGFPRTAAVDSAMTVAFNEPARPVVEQAAAQPTLEVVTGEANQRVVSLGRQKLKIGRSGNNDLIVTDQKTSREHAAVYFDEGHYIIEDLNSTNGVYLNDKLIHKIILKSGDRIAIGDTVLVFTQKEPEISLPEKQAFIQKSDLFSWLDTETRLLLAQNLVVRVYPKDATVLRQNTLVESMYFLYAGEIRIVEVNEEGGERNIDRLRAGDYFGERALLAGESGKYSMVATKDSTLLELRKERLNELLQKKPELNQAFYRMVLTKLRSAQVDSDPKGERKDNLKNIITSTDVQIIGEDKKIIEAKKKIEALAKSDNAALIIGPSGTGKETFARYFHKTSPHPDYPYVEVSVLDEEQSKAGAALFGIEADPQSTHMKGQVGYLEMIGMGTLTIVHAELLDVHQQSRLVTYLKFGWFHRNYGQESVKAKTRVILLANGTEAEVLEKFIPELREELKNRTIALPPLTQRLKDIPILADHYLKAFARKSGKRVSGLSREATEKLVSYSWPGNVEELANVIERSAIVSSEDVIIPGDLIFVLPSEKEIHKINILRQDRIRDFLRHPLVPKVLVWFNMFVVLLMAGFTLYGGSRPAGHPLQDFGNNAGMVITWLIWFPLLPVSAMLFGRIWCGMCPIAGVGELAARVKSFNLPVPKFIKRMDFWLIIISFLLIDYLEVYFGVPDAPWATGMLLVIIIGLSALFCVLYERKTFCRYLCPLAGMLGAYSTLSMVEVRGNKKVCQTQCGTLSCYKGTERAAGCPMFSYPASLETNTRCMMCLNCVKSCENRGVQINVRPPLQELWHQTLPILSLSVFGVMLVGMMANKQFPHLTYWLTKEQALGWTEGISHPVLFFLFLAAALVPFALASAMSAAASQEKTSENIARYGMAFIPLAFGGHMAHVAHEFLGDGVYTLTQYLVKVYDSVVHGIPIGSRAVALSPFIHGSIVTFLKVMIVFGGFMASLLALIMIARRFSEKNVFARILPHALVLMLFWVGYLFIFTGSTDEPAPPPAAATTAPQGGVPGPP